MTNTADTSPTTQLRNERTPLLGAALQNAYAAMECRKALAICDNDIERAADWLTSGNWLGAKLVSWDHEYLTAKAVALSNELLRPESECRNVLKNCAGNVELARRKLNGAPVLDPIG